MMVDADLDSLATALGTARRVTPLRVVGFPVTA